MKALRTHYLNREDNAVQAGPSTAPASATEENRQPGEASVSTPQRVEERDASRTWSSSSSLSLSQGAPVTGPHQVAGRRQKTLGKTPQRLRDRGSSDLRQTVSSTGDERNNNREALHEVRSQIMIKWLYRQQCRKGFISEGSPPTEGVVLKKNRGDFTCCPPQADQCSGPNSLLAIVVQMNVRCAMTVNTAAVQVLIETLAREGASTHGASTQGSVEARGGDSGVRTPDSGGTGRRDSVARRRRFVPFGGGLGIQVLSSMIDLPRCQLHHFAAFIEETRTLVVWDDDPENIMQRAETLEGSLIHLDNFCVDSEGDEGGILDEKKDMVLDAAELEAAPLEERRPVNLYGALTVMFTLTLCLVNTGLGWRRLAVEVTVDHDYGRLGLLALTPLIIFLSLVSLCRRPWPETVVRPKLTGQFFFQTISLIVMQIFGPASFTRGNSRYYSGKAPRRLHRQTHVLPHVTIQMPVYREGLDAVIRPTVMSLKAAISTYEMQGGSANIFVNDDGMQLLEDDKARARQDFYDEHKIGWVARPPHRPEPAPGQHRFLRRGKFKKASNMNYALHVSNRIEEKLAAVTGRGPAWTDEHELSAYYRCLNEVLEEDDGRTWADGNIRMGDYILIIDSDTRVPPDCLQDAVSEMEQSPDVGVLQFKSGVMNVTQSYFERGVTWFTHLIYTAITYTVAIGDVAPFVGHNAILRWSAIQDAAPYTDEDGYEKYWSESHVSEDFDIALRLQVHGYTIRYASYMGEGFKEGVSLTVYDELSRWEKYAYGCSELLFHPLCLWPRRGPFTPLFRQFITTGRIPLATKFTVVAYMGTYFALAAAWSLTLLNYFITGMFHDAYDKFYLDSFAIYIGLVIVFTGMGNIGLSVLRHRTKENSFLSSLLENLKWVPMLTIFLGGMSMHLSEAILCHLFSIDMVWGATAKEIENVQFGEEIWRVLRSFKWTFLFCFAGAALILTAYYAFPVYWRITEFYAIFPLANLIVSHMALPLLLNPALMRFTW